MSNKLNRQCKYLNENKNDVDLPTKNNSKPSQLKPKSKQHTNNYPFSYNTNNNIHSNNIFFPLQHNNNKSTTNIIGDDDDNNNNNTTSLNKPSNITNNIYSYSYSYSSHHNTNPLQQHYPFANNRNDVHYNSNNNNNYLQLEQPLVHSYLNDVLFYSNMFKVININNNNTNSKSLLSKHNKYIPRFCVLTPSTFKSFISKEKFLTLQKPILSINLSHIKHLHNNTHNTPQTYHHFTITYTPSSSVELHEIFALPCKHTSTKFLTLINHYINTL